MSTELSRSDDLPIVDADTFDLSALDADTQAYLADKSRFIKERYIRSIQNIVETGQALLDVKKRLGHGKFGLWLKTEFVGVFHMSERTAANFMDTAEMVGNEFAKFANLPPSALYLIASPSTPEDVRAQVKSGEIPPTVKDIKLAIKVAKQTDGKKIVDSTLAHPGNSEEKPESGGGDELDNEETAIKSLVNSILDSPLFDRMKEQGFVSHLASGITDYLSGEYHTTPADLQSYVRAFRTIATVLNDVADWLEE